jgi:hypothetical protein
MTELTVQNLVELYKFFATSMRVCIHKFWKVTVSLTVSLAVTIIVLAYMFIKPGCHDAQVCLFHEQGLKMTITITISFTLSIVYFICGGYLGRLRTTAETNRKKINNVRKDLRKIADNYCKQAQILDIELKTKDVDEFNTKKDAKEKIARQKIEADESCEQTNMIISLLEEDDSLEPIDGVMTTVSRLSYTVGVVIVVTIIIKFIVSCYCQSPMY